MLHLHRSWQMIGKIDAMGPLDAAGLEQVQELLTVLAEEVGWMAMEPLERDMIPSTVSVLRSLAYRLERWHKRAVEEEA